MLSLLLLFSCCRRELIKTLFVLYESFLVEYIYLDNLSNILTSS